MDAEILKCEVISLQVNANTYIYMWIFQHYISIKIQCGLFSSFTNNIYGACKSVFHSRMMPDLLVWQKARHAVFSPEPICAKSYLGHVRYYQTQAQRYTAVDSF